MRTVVGLAVPTVANQIIFLIAHQSIIVAETPSISGNFDRFRDQHVTRLIIGDCLKREMS